MAHKSFKTFHADWKVNPSERADRIEAADDNNHYRERRWASIKKNWKNVSKEK